jgi:hypothetical protein
MCNKCSNTSCKKENDRSEGIEAAIKYLEGKGKGKKHDPVLYASWEMVLVFMFLTMLLSLGSFFIGIMLPGF